MCKSPTQEVIVECKPDTGWESPNEVTLQMFASADRGAKEMSTGLAIFGPNAILPYHRHGFSEAVTILEGEALFAVEGRQYCIRPFDCIHIPAGVAHQASNSSAGQSLVALCAFASPVPTREMVTDRFSLDDRSLDDPQAGNPEHIVRYSRAPKYELAEGTEFCDLFGGRFGAVGICGGYGRFQPGSSLPCHIHHYAESITIIEGEAACEVMGRRHHLSRYDTAFVPAERPHRFLNEAAKPMAMIWVYGGSEPERTIVDVRYCQGLAKWEEAL